MNSSSCIQSIRKVIDELENVSFQCINLLEKDQESTHLQDISALRRYHKKILTFKTKICSKLDEDFFLRNLNALVKRLRIILLFFCKDVTNIINQNNLKTLKPILKDLTHDILILLTNISSLSKSLDQGSSGKKKSIPIQSDPKILNVNQESRVVQSFQRFFRSLGIINDVWR